MSLVKSSSLYAHSYTLLLSVFLCFSVLLFVLLATPLKGCAHAEGELVGIPQRASPARGENLRDEDDLVLGLDPGAPELEDVLVAKRVQQVDLVDDALLLLLRHPRQSYLWRARSKSEKVRKNDTLHTT